MAKKTTNHFFGGSNVFHGCHNNNNNNDNLNTPRSRTVSSCEQYGTNLRRGARGAGHPNYDAWLDHMDKWHSHHIQVEGDPYLSGWISEVKIEGPPYYRLLNVVEYIPAPWWMRH